MNCEKAILFCLAALFGCMGNSYSQVGYSFFKNITIDNAQVSGATDLTDFTILVNTTDLDLRTTGNGGDVTNANGYDIIFVDSNGTLLDHQIEKFVAATGEYIAWVKVPTLRATKDTYLKMYYGNSSVAVDPSTTDAWDANHLHVYHFDDLNDNKGANTLTNSGTVSTTGKIGDGRAFSGAESLTGTITDVTNLFTFSAWINFDGTASINTIFANTTSGGDTDGIKFFINDFGTSNGKIILESGDGNADGGRQTTSLSETVTNATWEYITAVIDNTGGTVQLFKNGVLSTTAPSGLDTYNTNATFALGTMTNNFFFFNGDMDEVKLATTLRSSDWILTEYNNQNAPSSFMTIASPPAPGGVSSGLSLWFKADAGMTLASGDVSVWANQAAGGNDAAQSTAASRPTLVTDDVNGNPTLNFDGNDYVEIPFDASLIYSDMSAYWIADVDGGDGTFRSAWSFRGGFDGYISYVQDNNEHAFWNGGGGTFQQGVSGNTYIDGYELMNTIGDVTGGNVTKTMDRNGIEILAPSTVAFTALTGFPVYIGVGCNDCGGAAFHWDGDISEVLFFDRVLSSTEQERVESYMAMKYGQTLGSVGDTYNYRSADGTVIWTGSAIYQNDIGAIARDDSSGLDQRKSQSENSDGMVQMALVDNSGTFSSPNKATADESFLIWGNDNGSLSEQLTEVPSSAFKRIGREWTVAENGTIGNVVVAMDTAGLDLPETEFFSFMLLVDTVDSDFSNGGTVTYVADSISSGQLFFNDINFKDGQFFTLATVPVSPGGVVSNLKSWYKADGDVETSGTSVTAWNDEFNDNDITNVISTPQLLTDSVNFNPVVYFDGTDDRLYGDVLGTDFLGATNNEWFLSAKKFSGTVMAVWEESTTNRISFEGGAILRVDHPESTVANQANSTQSITNKWRIMDGKFTPTNDTNFINGIEDGISTGGALNSNVVAEVTLGANNADLFHAEVNMGELILYGENLTTAQRSQVSSYLAIKYGQTLGTTASTYDYLDASGNTIWTGSATYQNDIAGIGRDDASGLDQRKSLSVEEDAIVTIALTDNSGAFDSPNAATADGSFLIWGNDNGSFSEQLTEVPSNIYRRIGREWTVAESGTVGSVVVAFDTTGLGLSSTSSDELAIMVDGSDADFSTGSIDVYPADSVVAGIAYFNEVDFADGDFFTLATIPVAPGGVVSNIQAWFKADGGVTLTGSTVTNWENQSISGIDEVTNVSTPNLVENLVNFNPAIEFDGIGDILIKESINRADILSESNNTSFSVFNPKSGVVIWKIEEDGFPNRHGIEMSGSNVRFDFPTDVIANRAIGSSNVLNNFILFSTQTSTTNDSTYINGLLEATSSGGVLSESAGNFDLAIGANEDGFFPTESDISEIVIYDADLSLAEKRQVESYLAIKYGASLGSSASPIDYLDASNNVIWTSSATYQNDIAGIGRDDRSGLDQRKSRSESSDGAVIIALTDNSGTFETPNEATEDQSFLIWGNDNGGLTEQVTEVPDQIYKRIGREWTISESGTIGNVVIALDTNGLGLSSQSESELILMVDGTDSDFSTGTVAFYPSDSITGSVAYFNDIAFADGDFFSFATVTVAPGGVLNNLSAWYKADGDIVAAGSDVTDWNTEIGSADLSSVTSTPQLYIDSANFNPAVYFDGVDDRLFNTAVTGSSILATNENDWFLAVKKVSGTVMTIWEEDINNRVSYEGAASLRVDHPSSAGVNQSNSTQNILDDWRVLNGKFTGTSDTNFIDGLVDGVSTGGALSTGAVGELTFGSNLDPAFHAEMNLGEVVMYNANLSVEDRVKVNSYLAIKYGITLGSQSDTLDYLSSAGDTIWFANSQYQKNIAGIGRDDASGLSQLQSTSQNTDDTVMVTMKVASVGTDNNFIVWGTDGFDSQYIDTLNNTPTGVDRRIARRWKVRETGDVTIDSLMIDLSLVPNNIDSIDLVLLLDDDGNFGDADTTTSGRKFRTADNMLIFTNINFDNDTAAYFSIGTLDESNTPLPVTFLKFEAELNEQEHVDLDWITALELNNDYFITEHSGDGLHWYTIDTTIGAGNSNEPILYHTKDEHPYQGENYYRIKQVDFDGNFSHSVVRVIEHLPQINWSLYPNPTDGIVTIEFDREVDEPSFKVTNQLGVEQQVRTVKRNNQTYELDLSFLSSAIYTITILFDNDTNVEKVLKW